MNTSSFLKPPLTIVKTGGAIMEDQDGLELVLQQFSEIEGMKCLIHGGGKLANRLADRLGIPQKMLNGRRVTDAETLEVVVMVYAGLINQRIVAGLQAKGCNAIGLSGADAGMILSELRSTEPVDFGFVGDVSHVNAVVLMNFLKSGLVPVISPITANGNGQLLNTNADTIAAEVAIALSRWFDVSVVFGFDKPGVLTDAENEASVLKELTANLYETGKQESLFSGGMLPKLDNAFYCLRQGVGQVRLGLITQLNALVAGKSGTKITL